MSDNKLYLRIAVTMAAILLALSVLQDIRLTKYRERAEIEQRNTNALLSDIKTYKVRDSLNAVRIESLELSLKEFEKYRAEDAGLIKDLKKRNEDLKSVNKTQQETIIRLSAVPKDTIVLIDSIPIPAKKVHCGDYWYDFEGILTESDFKGTLINRDSLLIAETIRYKRFLWFKTKKIKSREINAVSLNPHTEIMGMEHIIIE